MVRVLDYLPRGDMVDDAAWLRRHHFLLSVLIAQTPVLLIFGLVVGNPPALTTVIALVPLVTAAAGWFSKGRLAGSLWVTAGLSSCCVGLVILSGGSIEAHFSFFVIIGFLTLYQHWAPFVFNIAFTTLSHGLGSLLVPSLMFNHHAAQHSPWVWSMIHGAAVLLACLGVAIFCKLTEDEQRRRAELATELHDAQVRQQRFTSELLLNLARRNQSMFHRQLDIINDLEERERDPDALADLFRLDHLATRVRRNAESLLVLSGEQPARVWSAPVALRDVVRAGVAETEDLDRVTLAVDERPRIVGSTVADLTHMIAELVENAARYSPPTATVSIQSRPHLRAPGSHLLIIEDTGIGMPPVELDAANELLSNPKDVDVSDAARRLGFHVVARLAERHGIEVSLTPTPGCGVTAVLVVPAPLFAETSPTVPTVGDQGMRGLERVPASAVPAPRRGSGDNGNDRPAHEAPVSGPIAIDGRHAWPGERRTNGAHGAEGTDPEPGDGPARRGAHAAPGSDREGGRPSDTPAASDAPVTAEAKAEGKAEAVTKAAPADGADGHATVEEMPAAAGRPTGAGRRGLIHPIVVPPPAAPDPTSAPVVDPKGGGRRHAGTEAPETAGTAPAPRRSDEEAPSVVGPNGLVLARRRPQSHLAPELIRRPPEPAVAVTPGIPAATAASPAMPPGETPGTGAGRNAMDALSAYQASRAAARSAIGAPADVNGSTANDHDPHRGTTSGRQT
ncbi:ATP-binding protein [Actinomycetospora chibensis]|uniref:histidine kinase n=1 Tax=Actinomycetospora chibensis TaxID=663606 RepID=A0ABV9RFZ5_9PSEU|nr:ATP-binding protein [Actinomycetospora chibensis]MDD7922114.1 ATP-binding protein [Actinomycetospora chibensis]